MSPVAEYLAGLASALRTRGRRRRRILAECEGHLAEVAAARGEPAAVAAFGPADEVAAALDLETAALLGLRATWITVGGVVATAASTLVLINSAAAGARGLWLPAVAFFVAAQVAGFAAFAAVSQAAALRRRPASPSELVLLGRRCWTAILAAGLTMPAAGAALPGRGSAAALLAGPVALTVAAGAVRGGRRIARTLPGAQDRVFVNPLADACAALGLRPSSLARAARILDPVSHPVACCVLTVAVAGLLAFLRDVGEGATTSGATVTMAIEALAVVASFLVLGPFLGVRVPHRGARTG